MEDEKRLANVSGHERKSGILDNYDQLFERIAKTDILPKTENEWSPDDLKQTMDQVFSKYGQAALEVNDGKIFTTLSGGLDSTLALALLRRNFPESEIITMTMGGTKDHPDIQHARLAAERFSTTHHEFIPSAIEIAEAIEEYRAKFPEIDLRTAVKTGDFDIYLLYKHISRLNPEVILVHDGIDELMGGYWDHRKDNLPNERAAIYTSFWDRLIPEHLLPLTTTSSEFNISLLFPYIDAQIIKTISDIPLNDRSTIAESKKPLRVLALELGVPQKILTRSKRGQVGMLDLN